MGKVVEFEPRPQEAEPDLKAAGESWVERHRGRYFDRKWLVSKRGNNYVRCGEFCIATFRVAGGWKWSRARSAAEGPLYSRQTFDSESDARAAAWSALERFVLAKSA